MQKQDALEIPLSGFHIHFVNAYRLWNVDVFQVRISTADSRFGDYAEFAIDLAYHLHLRGIHIRFEGISEAEIDLLSDSRDKGGIVKTLLENDLPKSEEVTSFIQVCPPEQIRLDRSYRNISWLRFLEERVPSSWPEYLKGIEKVIVPSEYNRWALLRDAIVPEEKVSVLPVGFDERIYREDIEPYTPKNLQDIDKFPVRILSVLDFRPRRALPNMLYLYLRLAEALGHNRSCLILFSANLGVTDQNATNERIAQMRRSLVERGFVTDEPFHWASVSAEEVRANLSGLLRAGTHYLSTALVESWDPMALRAAAAGLHLFVPNHTWYNCSLPGDCATLLPVAEKLAPHVINQSPNDAAYYACDLNASCSTVLSNIIDPSVIIEKRRNMKRHLHRVSWDKVIDSYIEALA